MSIRKAIRWTLFWMGLALLFNLGIYLKMGKQPALEFFGGYVIEQSLSIDNLFLFLMIFTAFKLSVRNQRRVLFYGVMGAIVLRFLFILLGVALVNQFEWLLYVFGFILIFSGMKMLFGSEKEKDFKQSKVLKVLSKIIPISDEMHGDKFFVRKNKILYATPLLAILILVEGADIVFAIDSIPAIFSITTNAFIVFTSNIFAILGLRNMYFVLEKLHSKFWFVKYGVAFILTFTGIKLAILYFHWDIPITVSIAVIFGILIASVLISVIFKEKKDITV